MVIDLELNKKRIEVKNQINEGIKKTPMALFLNIPNRIFRKVTHSARSLSLISCVAILALTFLMILVVNYLVLFRQNGVTTQINPFGIMVVFEVIFLGIAGTYFNINRVLVNIRDALIESVVSAKDLDNLQQWLQFGWSPRIFRRFFFWWFVLAMCGSSFFFGFFFWQKGFSGFWLIIPLLGFGLMGAIALYYAPLMFLLPLRLQSYQLTLYESSPAHSAVIEDISTILNHFVYGYVLMSSLIQLSLTTIDLPISAQVVFTAIFAWIPIIIQFLANQICIRSIITLSKRKKILRRLTV